MYGSVLRLPVQNFITNIFYNHRRHLKLVRIWKLLHLYRGQVITWYIELSPMQNWRRDSVLTRHNQSHYVEGDLASNDMPCNCSIFLNSSLKIVETFSCRLLVCTHLLKTVLSRREHTAECKICFWNKQLQQQIKDLI